MFVFEKGDSFQDEIIQMLRRDKVDLGIDPMFISKRWIVGDRVRVVRALECADFLAYKTHKRKPKHGLEHQFGTSTGRTLIQGRRIIRAGDQ